MPDYSCIRSQAGASAWVELALPTTSEPCEVMSGSCYLPGCKANRHELCRHPLFALRPTAIRSRSALATGRIWTSSWNILLTAQFCLGLPAQSGKLCHSRRERFFILDGDSNLTCDYRTVEATIRQLPAPDESQARSQPCNHGHRAQNRRHLLHPGQASGRVQRKYLGYQRHRERKTA